MEVGVRLESGGIEPAAALGDDGGELVQRGDMPIGDRLIHQRPETFGGLELRPVGRQEDEADPVRDGQVFGAMPARVVEHEDDAAPTARAGLARRWRAVRRRRAWRGRCRDTRPPRRWSAARRRPPAATGSGGGRARPAARPPAPTPGAGPASGPDGARLRPRPRPAGPEARPPLARPLRPTFFLGRQSWLAWCVEGWSSIAPGGAEWPGYRRGHGRSGSACWSRRGRPVRAAAATCDCATRTAATW